MQETEDGSLEKHLHEHLEVHSLIIIDAKILQYSFKNFAICLLNYNSLVIYSIRYLLCYKIHKLMCQNKIISPTKNSFCLSYRYINVSMSTVLTFCINNMMSSLSSQKQTEYVLTNIQTYWIKRIKTDMIYF
jgi:hypothetical protein